MQLPVRGLQPGRVLQREVAVDHRAAWASQAASLGLVGEQPGQLGLGGDQPIPLGLDQRRRPPAGSGWPPARRTAARAPRARASRAPSPGSAPRAAGRSPGTGRAAGRSGSRPPATATATRPSRAPQAARAARAARRPAVASPGRDHRGGTGRARRGRARRRRAGSRLRPDLLHTWQGRGGRRQSARHRPASSRHRRTSISRAGPRSIVSWQLARRTATRRAPGSRRLTGRPARSQARPRRCPAVRDPGLHLAVLADLRRACWS